MKYTQDVFGACQITPPSTPLKARRIVATLVSSGYDDYLEGWLDTWTRYAQCPDVKIVVILINPTERLERLCAKYDAFVLRGYCTGTLGAHIKSALYSISRWVSAKQYLILDVDMLITGAFTPLFDVHETMPCHVIGMTPSHQFSDISDEVPFQSYDPEQSSISPYANSPEDYKLHIEPVLEGHPWRLMNAGMLIGSKKAFDALDTDLRTLSTATKAWVTHAHLPGASANDEFLCTSAIAKRDALWVTPDHYNFAVHCGRVGPRETLVPGDKPRCTYENRDIAVMHFLSAFGKSLIGRWRRIFKAAPYDPAIGPCPFPFYYKEREGSFDFHNLYRFAVERTTNGTMVEAGCSDARSLVFLAELVHAAGKDIQVHGVDYWFDFKSKTRKHRFLKEDCKRYGLQDIITLRETSSTEGAQCYEDKSLALVFLEVKDDILDVREDILAWKEKIEIGGILAGNGLTCVHPSVLQAVQETLGKPIFSFPRTWAFQREEQGWSALELPALKEPEFQEWAFRPLLRSSDPVDLSKEFYDAIHYGTNGAWALSNTLTEDETLRELQVQTLCEFLDPNVPCAEDIRGMVRVLVEGFCSDPSEYISSTATEALRYHADAAHSA